VPTLGVVRASSSRLSVTTHLFYGTSTLGGSSSAPLGSPPPRSCPASYVSHSLDMGDAGSEPRRDLSVLKLTPVLQDPTGSTASRLDPMCDKAAAVRSPPLFV
jgi:hypothetical protein